MKRFQETPNGKLINKNSFLSVIRESQKIYLAHITVNLDSILRSGAIYPSGGCLMGGIYTSPLFREGDKFRLHNLGEYILEKEAPRAAKKYNKEDPGILIFELSIPQTVSPSLVGTDYTRFGQVHLDIYRKHEHLIPELEKSTLYKLVLKSIDNVLPVLRIASRSDSSAIIENPDLFLDIYIKAIKSFPLLGFLYFEVISEYLMLHEDSSDAKEAHEKGEFYNHNYKDLAFALSPRTFTGEGLASFAPSTEQLSNYIQKEAIISQFSSNAMKDYLANRLVSLINSRLLDYSELVDPCEVGEVAPALLGHMIRKMPNVNKYIDFDRLEADEIWKYWNNTGIAIPFNGYFPKGETAINPAYPQLKYRVYLGKKIRYKNKLYITPNKLLDINIVPKLVGQQHVTMRL